MKGPTLHSSSGAESAGDVLREDGSSKTVLSEMERLLANEPAVGANRDPKLTMVSFAFCTTSSE